MNAPTYLITVSHQNYINFQITSTPFSEYVADKEVAEKLYQEKCLEYKNTRYRVEFLEVNQTLIKWQNGDRSKPF